MGQLFTAGRTVPRLRMNYEQPRYWRSHAT